MANENKGEFRNNALNEDFSGANSDDNESPKNEKMHQPGFYFLKESSLSKDVKKGCVNSGLPISQFWDRFPEAEIANQLPGMVTKKTERTED